MIHKVQEARGDEAFAALAPSPSRGLNTRFQTTSCVPTRATERPMAGTTARRMTSCAPTPVATPAKTASCAPTQAARTTRAAHMRERGGGRRELLRDQHLIWRRRLLKVPAQGLANNVFKLIGLAASQT